jgi:hypothetical protein
MAKSLQYESMKRTMITAVGGEGKFGVASAAHPAAATFSRNNGERMRGKLQVQF